MTGSPPPIIFGTDGWRGLIGTEMNDRSVRLVAQAFADYLNRKEATGGVAVGYDGRQRSAEFAELCARVIAANGFEVLLSESVVPTPVLSYAVHAAHLAAGVMITASHNPPQYNGVKFKADYGGPFLTEETRTVEELVGRTAVRGQGGSVRRVGMLGPYLAHVGEFVDMEAIGRAGLHVIVDSMGGAGRCILEEMLVACGCTARTIDGIPAGDFCGRNPEPIERNLGPLMDAVRADGSAAVGIATDGDADRLGVVMDGGRWLSAQETILLLADHVITGRRTPGNIVKTSSVTEKLRAAFQTAQRLVHDVQVGFKYVCEQMIAEPVAFGCEESGGYGFGGHIPERDGILSALILLEAITRSGAASLSELVRQNRTEFGPVHYNRVDTQYERPDRVEVLPALALRPPAAIAGFRVGGISTFESSRGIVNGLKFILEGSPRWLLLRASETEPVVRVYAEGESDDEVSLLLQAGLKFFAVPTTT